VRVTRREGSRRTRQAAGVIAPLTREAEEDWALKQKGRTERPLSFEEIGGAAFAPPLNTK
jgi:hypothetical protein